MLRYLQGIQEVVQAHQLISTNENKRNGKLNCWYKIDKVKNI